MEWFSKHAHWLVPGGIGWVVGFVCAAICASYGILTYQGVKKMNSPIAKLVNWQLSTGQLDHWTTYHIAAGLFIAKVAQWLGCSDLWAVLWVLIIGVAWEIFEYIVEGTAETYGTKKRWAYNTTADIIVEVGAAWWMVA